MANPSLKYVEVNGVDVSDYVASFNVTDEFDTNIKVATVGLKNTVSSVLDYNDKDLIGKIVSVKRGVLSSDEEFLFKGYVRKIDFRGGVVILACEDMLSETKYVIVNTSFDSNVDAEAGKFSEIFKTLINDHTGLVADSTSVQDSGVVNIIKIFVLRQRILFDALKELAFTLDWRFYYDASSDLVFFEPKGFVTSSVDFRTDSNVVKLPKWKIDSKDLFNKIVVIGAPLEYTTVEGPYKLDGSKSNWGTTSVVLDNKPISMKVFCDTSNPPITEKVGGAEGSIQAYDYSFVSDNGTITWNSDRFSPTTSYYAKVEYSYTVPIQVSKKRQASIDSYGLKQVSQYRDNIETFSDAANWADSQLDMYSEPFYSTVLFVKGVSDLKSGVLHNVVDLIQDVNQLVMIKKIIFRFPYRYDEVFVADKDYRTANWGADTLQRLKRLEEKQAKNSDQLTIFFDVNRDINIGRRYSKIQVKDRSSDGVDVFILGHKTFGVLGVQKLGDNSLSDWVDEKIVQGNNTYEEYCYDRDFDGVQDLKSGDSHTVGVTNASFASGSSQYGHYTTFTATDDYYITRVSVPLKKSGSPSMNVKCRIYSESGNKPDSLLGVSTTTLDVSTLTTSYVYTDFDFVGVSISSGVTYCIALVPDAQDSGNYPLWQVDNSEVGEYRGYSDTGLVWTATYVNQKCNFKINDYGLSLGVWDVSNKRFELSQDEYIYTRAIVKGAVYAYYTVTLGDAQKSPFGGTASTDHVIEISGDGKSTWETVTEGVRTAFSSADSSGVFVRIKNVGSDDVRIMNGYDDYSNYSHPVIKVVLEE